MSKPYDLDELTTKVRSLVAGEKVCQPT
jgi:hypothetical protein